MPLSEENATSAVLLSQILKRGCQKYGEMDEIVARLEELYGASITVSSDKLGENLSFSVQVYCMDDRFAVENEEIFESVLDIMSAILLDPLTENNVFRADFFSQEKKNHADLIRGMINDKRTFSMMRCKEIMFNDSSYRFTSNGTLEYLETITPKTLFSFYQNMIKNVSVAITYIGRPVDVEKLTKKYFSKILDGGITSVIFSDYKIPSKISYVNESCNVTQGKLCMGFRFTEPVDYFAVRLFNVIFGGSPTSKLFMNVREKLSLCYYCSSSIDPYVHSMFISAGIEFKNYDIAKDEIMKQLDDIKSGNITTQEFENSKLYLLDYIKGIKDSHSLLLANTIQNHLLGFNCSIEEEIESVSSLRPEQIVHLAKYLVPDTIYFLKGVE